MRKKNKHNTPERITELSKCEIFVFGSNLECHHYGGAARTAYEKFGAEWGVGDGPTGRCYAIPTMFRNIEDIRPYADKFVEYAKAHPQNRFLLTRVGCGIAGFKDIDMAKIFEDCINVPNITRPEGWGPWMIVSFQLEIKPRRETEEAPRVISDDILKSLCKKYSYQIGAGILDFVPYVGVRYVIDQNKFGYKRLGDFFFHNGQFYVWDTDDKWAAEHDQEAVLETFGDECFNRGYAHKVIFAGVNTRYRDSRGEYIYTGDVIGVKENGMSKPTCMALGTFKWSGKEDEYTFMLDNHTLDLKDCFRQKFKMTRVGTVFFRLDKDAPPVDVARCAHSFNMARSEENLVLMSTYTPNFDQEYWHYLALKILGAEYNWNK